MNSVSQILLINQLQRLNDLYLFVFEKTVVKSTMELRDPCTIGIAALLMFVFEQLNHFVTNPKSLVQVGIYVCQICLPNKRVLPNMMSGQDATCGVSVDCSYPLHSVLPSLKDTSPLHFSVRCS
jgi:hypothetical protein